MTMKETLQERFDVLKENVTRRRPNFKLLLVVSAALAVGTSAFFIIRRRLNAAASTEK